MKRFEHGGNVHRHAGVLDFSANLNPLGIPAAAREALAASVESFDVYPDPNCTELVSAIAAFEGVDASWVVPGAGATDILSRLAHVVSLEHDDARALVCAPCYSGYEQALEQAGVPYLRHELREENSFDVTPDILARINDEIGLVFLANPNNPTGRCLAQSVLEEVLDAAEEVGALVALDECFIDLTQQSGSNGLLAMHENMILVKALTKTFALAGLRVGYSLCAAESVNMLLSSLGQMWCVSTPAQVAGTAALGTDGYVECAQQLVAAERVRLAEALESAGFSVVPGEANYLFFKVDAVPNGAAAQSAHPLYDALLARGILIRVCENYHGLTGDWYRIAVRSPEENAQFIDALKEVCR